jgi:D-mannose binding lectin
MAVTIWTTNTSSVNSTSLKLSNEGNLILSVPSDNSAGYKVLWQSFEHMTDTFIQGMRMGINTKTGTRQLVTSWQSPDDPAPGNITFMCRTLAVMFKRHQFYQKLCEHNLYQAWQTWDDIVFVLAFFVVCMKRSEYNIAFYFILFYMYHGTQCTTMVKFRKYIVCISTSLS